jgi:hypothetical protein
MCYFFCAGLVLTTGSLVLLILSSIDYQNANNACTTSNVYITNIYYYNSNDDGGCSCSSTGSYGYNNTITCDISDTSGGSCYSTSCGSVSLHNTYNLCVDGNTCFTNSYTDERKKDDTMGIVIGCILLLLFGSAFCSVLQKIFFSENRDPRNNYNPTINSDDSDNSNNSDNLNGYVQTVNVLHKKNMDSSTVNYKSDDFSGDTNSDDFNGADNGDDNSYIQTVNVLHKKNIDDQTNKIQNKV